MARYRGTVVSGRSHEEVFDYLADVSNAVEWDPGVTAAERLDSGPVGLGSTFLLRVRVGARELPLEYRIVHYERPHRVTLVAERDTVRSEDTVTVVPAAGGGAVLTYNADLTLRGGLAPVGPLVGPAFRRIGDRGLAGLRRVLADPSYSAAGRPPAASTLARVVDEVLEATVIGSFSVLGPVVRRRAAKWVPPPPMAGKLVLVTGATSGIGLATAVGVARLGAGVVLTGRSRDRAAQAADHVRREVPDADVEVLLADMGEFEQVRALAEEFLTAHRRLDVLVHNAGALTSKYTATSRGIELTVASQVVAPFLLTGLLLPALRSGAPSRVLQVSSGGMYAQRFELDECEMGPEDYDGTTAYARAKRAQLVLLHEWVRRMDGSGIAFHAMHPGWADTPGIHTGLPGFARVMGPLLRSAEQGADTAVWLAAAPEGVATTGGFWLDRRHRWEHKVPWTRLSGAEFEAAGAELWSWCAARCGWAGLPAQD